MEAYVALDTSSKEQGQSLLTVKVSDEYLFVLLLNALRKAVFLRKAVWAHVSLDTSCTEQC